MSHDPTWPFIMTTGSRAKIEGMAGVSPLTRRGRLGTYMHAHACMHSRALVQLVLVQRQDVSRTYTLEQTQSCIKTHRRAPFQIPNMRLRS